MASQKSGVTIQPNQMPCLTARPMRSLRPAPKYCATNVLTNAAIPCGKQIIVQKNMPAGSAAAVDSGEYQVKNSRSMNQRIDQKAVCTTSGRAIASTSRPPQGRDHQSPASAGEIASRGAW